MAVLILQLGRPQCRAGSCGQEEEEREDWDEFQDHGNRPKPHVLPRPQPDLPLGLLLIKAAQLEPPVVCEFSESSARNDDKGWSAEDGNEVEGEEDDQLDDLYQAPWSVNRRACGLSKHLHRGRRIGEENAVGRDEVGLVAFDEGGLVD